MDPRVFYCLPSAVVLCKVVRQLEEVKTTLLVLIYDVNIIAHLW